MTNMKSKNRGKIPYTFLRVMTKIDEIHKKSRNYGTDEVLHEAEIHMIKSIKENDGIHVTGLADVLGVTKGAVSQIIQKLERKGMIVKDTDPSNLSRLVLRITSKGETAYRKHEDLHRQFNEAFSHALVSASEENKVFLKEFLDSLEKEVDTFENQGSI